MGAEKKIDETGNRYGMLTVLRYMPGYTGNGAYWLCRCDCGTEVAVLGIKLRYGMVRSCGCLRDMPRDERLRRGLKPHGKERVIRVRGQ